MIGNVFTTYAPAAGRLLFSEPFMPDNNFKRSVVLLCAHNADGSVGFILNRKLNIRLNEVIDTTCIMDIPLFLGGPVENNTLHYIHMDEDLADSAQEIGRGLYWGGDFDVLKEKLDNNTLDLEKFRFFLGYSGWGKGQLNGEMDAKSWIVTPFSKKMIFTHDDEESLWHDALQRMGGGYKVLANSPESPVLN
jgi:putative transcriptional regulator